MRTLETLADHHTPGQPWHVYCDACQRHVELDPVKLIEERGEGFSMARGDGSLWGVRGEGFADGQSSCSWGWAAERIRRQLLER